MIFNIVQSAFWVVFPKLLVIISANLVATNTVLITWTAFVSSKFVWLSFRFQTCSQLFQIVLKKIIPAQFPSAGHDWVFSLIGQSVMIRWIQTSSRPHFFEKKNTQTNKKKTNKQTNYRHKQLFYSNWNTKIIQVFKIVWNLGNSIL